MMMMMKTEYDDDRREAGGGDTGDAVLREFHSSEEDDTRSSSGGGGGRGKKKQSPSKALVVADGGGDGATIEVVRRPRGRPPGSKNKPKPPIIITREAESAMRPHVLEVPGGQDVVQAVTHYARCKGIGLCILAGSGTVANVTLRQPGPNPGGPTVTFHGRFDILSISATFLPPAIALASGAGSNGFSISLAGAQGQIVGGSVVGALLAVGHVVIVAAVFSSPTYHRLPVEEIACSGVPVSEAEGHHQGAGAAAGESCGMSLYSGQLPSDVIWAPTPRPSHPPY